MQVLCRAAVRREPTPANTVLPNVCCEGAEAHQGFGTVNPEGPILLQLLVASQSLACFLLLRMRASAATPPGAAFSMVPSTSRVFILQYHLVYFPQ